MRGPRAVPTAPRGHPPLPGIAPIEIPFEELQLPVQPENASPHPPAVQGRGDPEERVERPDHGDQQEDQPPQEHGDPEGEIALEEGPPGLVELLRRIAQRKIARLGGRELPRLLEDPRSGMDLGRRVEQEVLD